MTKYTKEQRLDIGRRVVEHEYTYAEAAEVYEISFPTVANYVKEFKSVNNVGIDGRFSRKRGATEEIESIEALSKLSKDELINEVIKAKIEEARAKKGYIVKGVGVNKEFIPINGKNSKS